MMESGEETDLEKTSAIMTLLPQPAIVGALKCQRDSYLREFVATVVSCKLEIVKEDKATKKKKGKEGQGEMRNKQLAVELTDTVLFPEGGGQPSDVGEIVAGSVKHHVNAVRREGLRAVHIIEASPQVSESQAFESLTPGTTVTLILDWKRRLDHMQQHTGQHLLSAILESTLNLKTLGWSMGNGAPSYVELSRELTDDELELVSDELNKKILENVPITVDESDKHTVNTSKVPDDYDVDNGVLRVVNIGSIDHNPCCGTHLSSTGQIQTVALLNQFSGKGSNSRLNFLAGDRVRKYAVYTHKIIKDTTAGLSCQTDDIPEKLEQLNINYRKALKRETSWKDVVAQTQIKEINSELIKKDVTFLYKPDVGLDYLTLLYKGSFKEIPDGKIVILLCGEGKNGGALLIYGNTNDDKISAIANHIQSILKTLKGGGKGKWQGKITSLSKMELKDTLDYLRTL